MFLTLKSLAGRQLKRCFPEQGPDDVFYCDVPSAASFVIVIQWNKARGYVEVHIDLATGLSGKC